MTAFAHAVGASDWAWYGVGKGGMRAVQKWKRPGRLCPPYRKSKN